ncbi:hypothetical protein AMTRI_Chr13g117180 [Amborella trichopoda]
MATNFCVKRLFQTGQRRYTVAAVEAKASIVGAATNLNKTPESTATKILPESKGGGERSEQIFWMRDPVTGNWIPENHFGAMDVAELREKLLSKK